MTEQLCAVLCLRTKVMQTNNLGESPWEMTHHVVAIVKIDV